MLIKSKYLFEYQKWRILEHIFGGKSPSTRLANKRKKIFKLLKNDLNNSGVKPIIKQVDRVCNISESDLKKLYVNKGIPVVLEAKAKNWIATKKWSPEWLLENYCDDKIALFDASSSNTNSVNYNIEETTLNTVLEAMISGDTTKYSRFNRILYDHPELINDFDWKWLYGMRSKFSSGKTFQVFIGGKNTHTSLHAASENNLFTQVYGKKHWYLYPPEYDIIFNPPVTRSPYFYTNFNPDIPDFEIYPNAKYMTTWECELNAGDILYNPPSWCHHVTNKTDSIGVGFRWFNLKDSLKMSFAHTLLTILSTNPPIWYANKNRTDFAKIFKYMNSIHEI